jgi:hypothetical protein
MNDDAAAQQPAAPDPNPAPTPPTEVAAAPQTERTGASASPTPSVRSVSTRANVEPSAPAVTPVDEPPPSAEPVTEAASEPAAPAAAELGGEVVDHGEWREEGRWAGLPRYACNSCAFDTLHIEDIEAHVREHRTEGPPARIYDARGELIELPK